MHDAAEKGSICESNNKKMNVWNKFTAKKKLLAKYTSQQQGEVHIKVLKMLHFPISLTSTFDISKRLSSELLFKNKK